MTYQETLKELADRDENIVVMTAENRAAIRDLPQHMGNRFIDVGICEQTMVGAAAGLALRGRTPVVHALATFLTLRAFEFIRTDVGIGNLPVKLVGGVPGFLSDANGPTHQAIEDISLMRGIPNMEVFCPADEVELVEGMRQIVQRRAPCYVRFNSVKPAVKHQAFEVGKAEVLSNGNDVAILVYGFLLREALKAKDILEGQNISVRLINMRMLKPIDEQAILSAAKETRLVVTVEDHFLTGGLYSILGEVFLKHRVTANVMPIALENRWFTPALLDDVLRYEGFTGGQIAQQVAEALGSSRPSRSR
jgi:transketolase